MKDWMLPSPDDALGVALSTAAVFFGLLLIVRTVGLRSFSKMTSVDFAVTIAIGSILASTLLSKSPPVLQGLAAVALLLALQAVISFLRSRSPLVGRLTDNQPLLLMAAGEVLHDNLRRARVSESDLRAKLREANVLHPREVRAVVFETTGDVSVLHGDPDGPPLDRWLLEGVRDAERLG